MKLKTAHKMALPWLKNKTRLLKLSLRAFARGKTALGRSLLGKCHAVLHYYDGILWYALNTRAEIHLVHHCNLKCASCLHFSPLCRPWCISLKELEDQLSSIANCVEEVRLLGGEPLLHPQLGECLRIARKCLPHNRIILVSNGLLFRSVSDDLLQSIIENRIQIRLSVYPIDLDYDKIIEDLKKKGADIAQYVNFSVYSFTRMPLDPMGCFDPKKAFAACAKCVQIVDGKVFPCPTIAYSNFLNEAFGTHFETVPEKDYLWLKDVKDEIDVIDFLREPKPFCRYCSSGSDQEEIIEYHSSRKEAQEWIIHRS